LLKTLDRYVIRSFLFSYAISLVVMIVLAVVIEAFLRLDDFVEAAHDISPNFGVLTLMLQYYTVRLPIIFHILCPAVLLVGAMFTVGQLNRHNELLAMRAAGISVYRTIAPIFLITVLITGVLIADQELVIPALIKPIREAEDMLSGAQSNEYKNLEKTDYFGNRFQIASYQVFERKMVKDVNITAYYPSSNDMRLQIKAREGAWKRSEKDGKGRWHLSDGHIYAYDTAGNEIPSKQWDMEPDFGKDGYVILGEEDSSNSFFQIQSNLTWEDMTPNDPLDILEWQSTGEILRSLKASNPSADLFVAFHRRIAFPLSNIVLLMLGLPFVLGGEGRSTFVGLGICIIICAAFYGISILCTELGNRAALSPPAAAWLPIVLFLPTGLLLFDGVKT